MKYLIRMMLSFKSDNVLSTISDVSVDIMNKAAISNQMQIECSPVRYQPGQPPQVVIMAMLKEASLTCPTINIGYSSGGPKQSGIEIRLPIYMNKTIMLVDQMNQQAFKKNWDDISFNRPNQFQKLDTILKNPAPPQVPIEAVVK